MVIYLMDPNQNQRTFFCTNRSADSKLFIPNQAGMDWMSVSDDGNFVLRSETIVIRWQTWSCNYAKSIFPYNGHYQLVLAANDARGCCEFKFQICCRCQINFSLTDLLNF